MFYNYYVVIQNLRFQPQFWTFLCLISVIWKIFESTYNSLPHEDFEFIFRFPEFGVEEISGPMAIIICWAFTGFYFLLFIIMAIVVSSQISMLHLMVSCLKCEISNQSLGYCHVKLAVCANRDKVESQN